MADIFAYGMPDAFRERLACEAVGCHRVLFLRWASYYDGFERYDEWCPDEPSDDRLLEIIRELSEEQLDELSYRGLIAWRFDGDDTLLQQTAVGVYLGPKGAKITYDLETQTTRYHLFLESIFLLPGDLEVLALANFPSRPDDMFAALWRRIAPKEPHQPAFITLCQRREQR